MTTLHRGQIFHISGHPKVTDAAGALVHLADGGLAVDDDGIIAWCGEWRDRPADLADAEVIDHSDGFLLPGFVDTHMHFPQVFSADGYGGGQLLEWLNHCIFPGETRLREPEVGERAATTWCDRMITAGTTTGLIFGSQFPAAQDALFRTAGERGLRIVSGRTTQTTGPESAAALMTSEAEAIDLVRNEIERWHPMDAEERQRALVQVAVVPRFSLAVTRETLAALGELYDEYRPHGVYFTSHLNENNRPVTGEVAEVRRVYEVADYLDTYDGRFLPGSRTGGLSMLGSRSVMAHGVHCSDRELARMAETGTSIAHCPVSQLFLGSGTMPWLRTIGSGVNVALGTDYGGGDEWFMPSVLNAAFKVHIGEPGDAGVSIHPAELLFTGTLAGARALDLEDRIGNFDVGKEADFVVIEPDRWEFFDNIITHGPRSDDPIVGRDALLFALLMAVKEAALTETYVRGRRLVTSTASAE